MSPAALVAYAKEKDLAAIALTDHDTIDGLDEAIAEGKKQGVRVVPGIELSTEYMGKDIHIVGLNIEYKNEAFMRKVEEFVDTRETRNQKMCEKLTEAGLPLSVEDMKKSFGEDTILTRAHFARILLEKGYTKSLKEAFERYIGDTSPCFVPREKITPAQAVEFIKEANGIPILAHPVLYHMSKENLCILVRLLKDAGLEGIEAIYSTYTASDERDIRKIAKEFNLKISGGSDFHGDAKPGLDLGTGYGKLFVPEEILDDLLG